MLKAQLNISDLYIIKKWSCTVNKNPKKENSYILVTEHSEHDLQFLTSSFPP